MTLLSIIIPAFREEPRIRQSIQSIDQWITESGRTVEILIIVEPCPDKTLEVARKAASECVNKEMFNVVDNQIHRGKGYAVRCGMKRAKGDVRMFMDADLSVPLSEIDNALGFLSKNRDVEVLVGSRHDGGTVVKKQGVMRRLGSRAYNLMLRGMGLTGIKDTQCGFKFFRGKGLRAFDCCQVDGFGFDIELLLSAKKENCSVSQLPVMWYNSDESSFDPLKDGFKVLIDSFHVWRRLS